ncbi:hypothetical protein KCP76_00440 [Salmonella enterica subsp. enterica serovar Weltevreden]|nr:hypothetical protein KCP76_00440 [Salmonella enterica subsp. enterica serovar Weltevreden]
MDDEPLARENLRILPVGRIYLLRLWESANAVEAIGAVHGCCDPDVLFLDGSDAVSVDWRW